MLVYIKKNKQLKFTSFLLTGISNNNIFCQCGCNGKTSCKEKEGINNNDPTQDPPKDGNPLKNPPIEDPNKKPDETPDHGKDPNGGKPKEDNFKNIKETLKKFLNSVIENNNNLEEKDRIKIVITEDIIDSKNNKNDLILIENELNDINNKIIKKMAEISQEKAKKILKNECITLFDNCENLNNDLDDGKKIDLGITKKQIEDE